MLTTDLVRVSVRKGVIKPRYIDPADETLLRRARELCALFSDRAGTTRAAHNEAIADLVGDDTTFALTKGLVKLLDDRSEWTTVAPLDPVALRRHVFEAASQVHPVLTRATGRHKHTRDTVIARVAQSLSVTPEDVESGLYADLKSEQRLSAHKPIEPEALLHRYNLALAQGVLLRATELRLSVRGKRPKHLRRLFYALKFRGLMHRATRTDEGWQIVIDGPMSLFRLSSRYGLQLAIVLADIAHLDAWELEADVLWSDRTTHGLLKVSSDDGLVSHTKPRGTWTSAEEKRLRATLAKRKKLAWSIDGKASVVELGGRGVLVPDFVLRHDDGREVFVEIVGYWRKAWFEKRAELLAAHGPRNLVLCVSKTMATEDAPLPQAGLTVVAFRDAISAKRLLEAAEAVAE